MALDAGSVFVKLGALVDDRPFDKYDREVEKAKIKAANGIKADLGADFDKRGFERYHAELAKVRAESKARDAFKVHLGANYDDKAFKAYSRDADKAAASNHSFGRSNDRVNFGLVQLTSRLPLAKWGAFAVGGVEAAQSMTSLIASLGPLVGLLGAIPGAASAAAQGIGSIMLATAGVGDGIKAAIKAQDSAATDAVSSGKAASGAAEGIRSARLGLADSIRQEKIAEEDMTTARRTAIREMEDQRRAVEATRIAQIGANLSLKEAEAALRDIRNTPGASDFDIADAEQRVREARKAREDAAVERKRADQDQARSRKGGLKHNDTFESAKRSLDDANRAVAESEHQVDVAAKNAADSMAKGSSSATALDVAMKHLPKSAQDFVHFIVGMRPAFDDLRKAGADELFPRVEKGITGAAKNLPVVRKSVADTSKVVGQLAEQFGTRLGSKEWGRDLADQSDHNTVVIHRLGEAGLSLAEVFRDLMIASQPVTDWLSSATEKWAKNREQQIGAARETGKLNDFFEHTVSVGKRVSSILQNVGEAIFGIGRAANNSKGGGDDLLKSLDRVTAQFNKWVNSVRGQNQIEGFFEDARGAGRAVREEIGKLIDRFQELKREGKTNVEALAITFSEAFSKMIPIVVKEMANRGPEIAKALVEGFLSASIWGKLVIGTWFLSKMGGAKLVGAIGTRIGGMIATSMAEAVVGSAAFSKIAPRLAAMLAGVAGGAGAAGAAPGVVAGEVAGAGMAGGILAKLRTGLRGAGIAAIAVEVGHQFWGSFNAGKQQDSSNPATALKGEETAVRGSKLPILGIRTNDLIESVIGKTDQTKNLEKVEDGLRKIADEGRKISPKEARELNKAIDALPGLTKRGAGGMHDLVNESTRLPKALVIKNAVDSFSKSTVTGFLNARRVTKAGIDNMIDEVRKLPPGARVQALKATVALSSTLEKEGKLPVGSTKKLREAMNRELKKMDGDWKEHARRANNALTVEIAAGIPKAKKAADRLVDAIRSAFGGLRNVGSNAGHDLLGGLGAALGAVGGKGKGGGPSAKDFLRTLITGKGGVHGGLVTTSGIRGYAGGGPVLDPRDTVPAMLEPGEFVMQKSAVQQHGKGTLSALNKGVGLAAALGGEKPKTKEGVKGLIDEVKPLAPGVVKIGKLAGKGISDPIAQARKDARDSTKGLRTDTQDDMKGIQRDSDKVGKKIRDNLVGHMSDARSDGGKHLDRLRDTTSSRLKEMSKIALTQGAKFTQALSSSMGSSDRAVDVGVEYIGAAANAALRSFGAKGVTLSVPKPSEKAGGGPVGAWGEAGRDEELVLMGRGEAVLNRHQQGPVQEALAFAKHMGASAYGSLQDLFGSVTTPHFMARGGGMPGFAKGGTKMSALLSAANRVSAQNYPYKWGGGHESNPVRFPPPAGGYDCSGAISYLAQSAGYHYPTAATAGMLGWGMPRGAGAVTIYDHPYDTPDQAAHTFAKIGSRFWGTSGFARPGGGAGWFNQAPSREYLSKFQTFHLPGLGGKAGDLPGDPSIPKVTVKGPAGALKSLAQASINRVSKAAGGKVQKAFARAGNIGGGQALGDTGSVKALPGGWHRTGFTVDPGSDPKQQYANGMSFAELLQAGANRGLHPNLTEILGEKDTTGYGMGYPVFGQAAHPMLVRRPGGKHAYRIVKSDVGSGQRGDPRFTTDLHGRIANLLKLGGKGMIDVKKAMKGGFQGLRRFATGGGDPRGNFLYGGLSKGTDLSKLPKGRRTAHPKLPSRSKGTVSGYAKKVKSLAHAAGDFPDIQSQIGVIGDDYTRAERHANLVTEELVVSAGEVGYKRPPGATTDIPYLDMDAFNIRKKELWGLLAMRRKVVRLWDEYARRALRARKTVQAGIKRLTAEYKHASKKNKPKIMKQITGLKGQDSIWKSRLGSAAKSRDDAWLDFEELRNSANTELGQTVNDELNPKVDTGTDISADDQALLDQANTKNTVLTASLNAAENAFNVFAGAGDIGAGAGSALGAAANPMGVPGAAQGSFGGGLGLTMGADGRVYAPGPGGQPTPVPDGMFGVNVTFKSLHPGDPEVQRQLAKAAAAGFGQQGYRSSNIVDTKL